MKVLRRLEVCYHGFAPFVFGALVALDVVWRSWPYLNRQTLRYEDPVVGFATWQGLNKAEDYSAAYLLVIVTALVGLVAGLALRALSGKEGVKGPVGRAANNFLVLSMAPAAWRFTIAALNPQATMPVFTYMILPPLGVLILCALLAARYRRRMLVDDVYECVGSGLLCGCLGLFGALGVALAIVRLNNWPVIWLLRVQEFIVPLGIAAGSILVLLSLLSAASPASMASRLRFSLVFLQLPCLLLLFALIPAPLIDEAHGLTAPYPTRLVVTLVILVLLGAANVLWRGMRSVVAGNVLTIFAPAAAVALVIFALVPDTSVPVYTPDQFHFGEQLLPWQQWTGFGKIPYVDFIPIHGLMPIGRGALNAFFFDGTAASFRAAWTLLAGLIIGLIAFGASTLVNPVAALILCLAGPIFDRFYIILVPLFLLCSPRLLNRRVAWLVVFVVALVLAPLYNAALGLAAMVGLAPVAIWQFYQAWRENRRSLITASTIVIVLGIAALLVPMVRHSALGFVQFVRENEWTNDAVNSVPWSIGLSHRDSVVGIGTSEFSWDCARFAWLAVAAAGAWVLVRELARSQIRPHVIVSAIAIPLALMVSSKYTVGRIEPGYLTRPGAVTCLCTYFIIPLYALMLCGRENLGKVAVAVSALSAVMFIGTSTSLDAPLLIRRVVSSRVVPDQVRVVRGADVGLPRLGNLAVTEGLDDLLAIRSALGEFLRKGETFLDLTNASGFYYYLDLPVPTLYSSNYVAANSIMEERMLRQLRDNPPPVVLASPGDTFDGGPAGLRSYELYRYALLNYVPVKRGKFVLLVHPDRLASAQSAASAAAEPATRPSNMDLLADLSAPPDLDWIPFTWGKSWLSLKRRFDLVASLEAHPVSVQGARPAKSAPSMYENAGGVIAFTYALPDNLRRGTTSDFMHFSFRYTPSRSQAQPSLQVRWVYDDGSTSPGMTFIAQSGEILVPLGAYPQWLLSDHLHQIRIECNTPSELTYFSFGDIQMLRLLPILRP